MTLLNAAIAWVDARARFREWGPRTNPLIVRLLRRPAFLTLRESLWLSFGLGLLALAYGTYAVLHATSDSMPLFDTMLFITGWLLTGLAPLITASAGVLITAREIRPDPYDLLRLTPLPGATLVRAYVFTTLYRLRYLYVALVALMPVLVVRVFFLLIVLYKTMQDIYTGAYWYGNTYEIQPPAWYQIVLPTLAVLGVIIGLWGMNLLAAAWGVRAALERSINPAWTATSTPMAIGAVMLCLCVMAAATFTFAGGLFVTNSIVQLIVLGFVGLVFMLLPYLLGAIQMIQAAQNYDRRHNYRMPSSVYRSSPSA
jgi:hypothetical protein